MKIEYDEAKNRENIAKHGISFEIITDLDWNNIVSQPDNRKNYGEVRIISYGTLKKRLYVLVWTARNGNIRPISFRKANNKEVDKYEKKAAIY